MDESPTNMRLHRVDKTTSRIIIPVNLTQSHWIWCAVNINHRSQSAILDFFNSAPSYQIETERWAKEIKKLFEWEGEDEDSLFTTLSGRFATKKRQHCRTIGTVVYMWWPMLNHCWRDGIRSMSLMVRRWEDKPPGTVLRIFHQSWQWQRQLLLTLGVMKTKSLSMIAPSFSTTNVPL